MPEIYNEHLLKAVEYDAPKEELTITFSTGFRKCYFGVSKSVYEDLLSSSSRDDYFKANIEHGGYPYHNC